MNNENAIRVLEEFKVIDDWTIVHLPEMEDAVDVAIEALKVHDICAEMLESAQLVSIDGDTISRQDAIAMFEKHCYPITYDKASRENGMTITGIREVLKSLPSAPDSRQRGEWKAEIGYDGEVIYYECSHCGDAFTLIDGTPEDNNYNFCPNCGADNRGEKE